MNALKGILMGIIQGLTEFLPVSSSGHLELAKVFFGDDSFSEESLLFTIILHFATALSTIVVFRKNILGIVIGVFKKSGTEEKKFAIKIILSMIPAVAIGLFFEDAIDSLFNGNVLFVGFMLILTAILLFISEKTKPRFSELGNKESIIMGVVQALAVIPGISRSGATICTGLLMGIDKQKATQFSFLMVLPLIFGSMAKKMIDGGISIEPNLLFTYILGFAAAFLTGTFACRTMIRLVRSNKLIYFAIYCFLVGITVIVYKSCL